MRIPEDKLWRAILGTLDRHDTVECSLLGRVDYRRDRVTGEPVGVIDPDVQREAARHGCVIVGADWKRDVYRIQKAARTE